MGLEVAESALKKLLWHPWQILPPGPPDLTKLLDPSGIETPAGVWGRRPWQDGLHRVEWMDGNRRSSVEILVDSNPRLPWGAWQAYSHGRRTVCATYGPNGYWFRYPAPPDLPLDAFSVLPEDEDPS